MPSTYSPILKLELMANGEQSGTWGTITNTNLGTLIEQAIAGTATLDVTSADVTLTNLNGQSDTARCAALYVTGTPGTTRNIIAPAVSKLYVIANATASSVIIKTSSSTGYTINAGNTLLVYYNGTDFILVGQTGLSTNTPNSLILRDASGNFSAGTITANLTGNASGTAGNITGTLAVAQGGTGATTVTGIGANVLASNAVLTNANLGTPSAISLINGSGLPLGTGVTGTLGVANGGTGTITSSGVAGSSVVLNNSPSITGATLTYPVLSSETFSTTSTGTAGTNAQGQGTIVNDFNVVTTTAANPSGVTLPVATIGRRIIIANKGTNPINVYPNTGAYIDALSVNTSISIPVSGVMEFNASTTTQWYSSYNYSVLNAGVASFSAGTTGFTPSSTTTGAITLGGTLGVANGGTGTTTSTGTGSTVLSASPTFTGIPLADTAANGTNTRQLATTEFVINNIGAISSGVTTFSAGTTGFTPVSATSGAVTLGGTLGVANGGTGVSTLTGIVYASGTSAFAAATGTQIATAIGSATVTNATNATNATTATTATNATTAAACSGNSATATTATNVSGTVASSNGGTGVAGTLSGIPYANGTSAWGNATGAQIAGAIGSSTVTNATNATSATSATTATYLAGGAANRFPYQTSVGVTAFLAAPTTANTSIVYDGSTLSWAAAGAVAGGAVFENSQAITTNYTMTTSKSGMSAGPITISTGVTVTIPSGSRWVVL